MEYSGNLYHVNFSAKKVSESGIPNEWIKFIEEFITKDMVDTIEENVKKIILEPLLDNIT